ncbi:hypothetical protein SETIT_5G038300v2 [Setaria italica]|uniref:Uncharacterized protein n=1 Tax=Setaria italica TaxID=4555 RepID=A0A368R0Y5_SETIT|nr:hypothetical protein SETIT_5G038300v2 [Setaria italica]
MSTEEEGTETSRLSPPGSRAARPADLAGPARGQWQVGRALPGPTHETSPLSSASSSFLLPRPHQLSCGGGCRIPGFSEPPGTAYEDPVACASCCMSTMAWYPLPQSGAALSAGDEFLENQSAGWSLWSFTSSDDHDAAAAYPETHGSGAAPSEEGVGAAELLAIAGSVGVVLRKAAMRSVVRSPVKWQWRFPPLLRNLDRSQFSDEEMRRMDAPFEALDMFPDSMHRLLSYEDMLSGVLTGSSSGDGEVKLERDGVDAMDTCGFPLFSHDLQNAEPNGSEEMLADTLSMDKDGMGTVKRSRSFADDESAGGFNFESLVLEELEDVVFQLTKKTRICFRDAFFRMAETSSNARCGSRIPAAADCCPERATNAIDRTVADLTMRPPSPAPLQDHGSCFDGGGSGAEAQSTTGWTATA